MWKHLPLGLFSSVAYTGPHDLATSVHLSCALHTQLATWPHSPTPTSPLDPDPAQLVEVVDLIWIVSTYELCSASMAGGM